MLLLLSASAIADANAWPSLGPADHFSAWHQPIEEWYEAGHVIQENVEVPWACGPNWDRKQFPRGPVILQGDYGPVAFRNVRVRPWKEQAAAGLGKLNVPPPGFTALFNGKDFTGWRVHPKVKEMWLIEDGILKSHGLLEEWGADLATEKEYRDYVLMADFRMPEKSDSGIFFRNLAPAVIGPIGDAEQFKIGPWNGKGRLGSFLFLPVEVKQRLGLKPGDQPQVKSANPEIGVWHTVKLTVVGKTLTAELDGEVILDRFEYPEGILSTKPNPIRFQKHRFTEGDKPGERNPCPIEFRNIFLKEIHSTDSNASGGLNVPPPGFTALFNGKDFTGWHTPPLVKQYWTIEDGVLKSPGLIETWGASLVTKKKFRDFVLLIDFRMPAISDSGISFRRLIPQIQGFGDMEQFNLRSRGGMGHLESYYFLPNGIARRMKLREEEEPHVRHIDPEVGVWHTVKLTLQGRTFSAEYDGEVLLDQFQYHDWMMNLQPAPIVLQKHIVVDGDNLGQRNPCPIEFRNIFVKELDPEGTASAPSSSRGKGRGEGGHKSRPMDSSDAALLTRIDANDLPKGYEPAKHQEYVDQRMEGLSDPQRGRISQLWKEKEKIDPDMLNRGFSFVKIMTYVAEGERLPAENNRQKTPSMDDLAKLRGGNAPESRASKPANDWEWSAETDAEGESRKAFPIKISEERTLYVAPFDLAEGDTPPVVLLPESRLAVTGCLATAHPVYFGITMNHPNLDFAGRFVTMRAADEFQSGREFQVTLDSHDFQMDSSLVGMKDNLPARPFHFVVESIWFTTLEKEAGLEIIEVKLIPPSQDESD